MPDQLSLCLDAPARPERALSKSKYISGLQCHKLLWHQYNAKELIPAVDAAQQAIFEQGHEVGRRARQLFPGGVLIERDGGFAAQLADTAAAMELGVPVYEASFLGAGAFAQIDILVPTDDPLDGPGPGRRWDLVEVKSSTSVKPVYLDDVAVQRYAAEASGTLIRNCYVAHINREYVREGEIDNSKLFRIVDVTAEVAERLIDLPARIDVLTSVIEQPASPEVAVGPHCSKPHSCPLISVCWPNGRVTRLARGTERQAIQVAAEASSVPHVEAARVQDFLQGLTYPLFFLDFETFGTAIPLLDGTRPYQQVPFQFSLHVRREPGADLTHHGFLADAGADPRVELLQWMRDRLEHSGSIVVYFAGFETGRLTELARDFPAYAPWIEEILSRVVDLHAPFKAFDVYHPLQHGSTSIKAVLPALTGTGYDGMAIGDGVTASLAFLQMAFGTDSASPAADAATVRQDLEAYCRLDTLAMVQILEAMERLAGM